MLPSMTQTAAAKKGGLLSAMRQLADGHWVLAFQSPERAAVAQRLVQQHNAHIRQLYEAALEPLCAAEVQQAHECTVSVEQQPWQQQQLQQAGA
jgi:hypothetical protein